MNYLMLFLFYFGTVVSLTQLMKLFFRVFISSLELFSYKCRCLYIYMQIFVRVSTQANSDICRRGSITVNLVG